MESALKLRIPGVAVYRDISLSVPASHCYNSVDPRAVPVLQLYRRVERLSVVRREEERVVCLCPDYCVCMLVVVSLYGGQIRAFVYGRADLFDYAQRLYGLVRVSRLVQRRFDLR